MNMLARAISLLCAALFFSLCVATDVAAGESDASEPAIDRPGYIEMPAERVDLRTAQADFIERIPRWLDLTALMAAGASEQLVAGMDVDARFHAPRLGPFDVELRADAETMNHGSVHRAHRLGAGARLGIPSAYGEFWAGGGGGGAWDGAAWNGFSSLDGGWDIRVGRMSASFIIRNTMSSREYERVSYVSSGPPIDSMAAPLVRMVQRGEEQLSYTDTEMGLTWMHGKVEIGVLAGMRFGGGSVGETRWLQLSNSYWVSGNFALVLQGGRRPGSPEMGMPGESYFTCGANVRFPVSAERTKPARGAASAVSRGESVPPAFSMAKLAGGVCRIAVVVTGARTVLISGDFSDWRPLPMRRTAGDVWIVEVSPSPGTYKVSISIDGGPWQAPPGLTAQRDEFDQTSGIMLVK